MKLRIFELLLIGAILTQAFVLQGRGGAPKGWKVQKRSAPSSDLTYTFNLRYCNAEQFDALFWDISNPKSDNYANYLTREEVDEITSCPGDKEALKSFLSQFELKEVTEFGNAIRVSSSIKIAEQMLQTEFHHFQHTDSKKTYIRQLGDVTLPNEFEGVVLFITGVSDFFHDNKYAPLAFDSKKKTSMQSSEYDPNMFKITDPYVNPFLLQTKYGIPSEALVAKNNSIGIAAFE